MRANRIEYAVAAAVLLCAAQGILAHGALAQDAPRYGGQRSVSLAASRPIAIPQEMSPPQEAYASFPETSAETTAPAAPSVCQARLAKVATFQPLPVLVGPGECGATDAVLLQAIALPDQGTVAVEPAATLRCPMAEQVAQWVRDDVEPSVIRFGGPLRVLDNFDSYECRGRNRIKGAVLSEHGRANALDVRLFKLANGVSLTLTDVHVDKSWRDAMKASACARFSTVLGPGSDGAHEEHIHVDLAERRGNYKYCHWEVYATPVIAQAQTPPPADKGSAPQAAAPEDEDAASAPDEAASIPIDAVPLPRPRPRSASAR